MSKSANLERCRRQVLPARGGCRAGGKSSLLEREPQRRSLIRTIRNGATKLELGTTNRGCNSNTESRGDGTGKGSGFVIINKTGSPNNSNGSNKVIADVHLPNAAPNTTYNVRLIELQSSAGNNTDTGVVAATIQTNAAGKGNVNLQENVVPNATGAWVSVVGPNFPTGGPDLYTSDSVVPV